MDPSAILTYCVVGIGCWCVGFALGHRAGAASATDLMEAHLRLREIEWREQYLAKLANDAKEAKHGHSGPNT